MSEENLVGGIVNAQVSVESLPASRQIVAVERQADGTWRVCGHGQSGADGLAEFSVQARPESTIYALAVDEWGTPWTSGMTVAVGDLVRPTNFVGWLYRATQGGALPVDEPVWWNSSSLGPQPAGTAVLEAERYYQPISHGPLAVEFTDEFDADWPSVAALLHFDGSPGSAQILDETGRVWTAYGNARLAEDESAFGGSSLLLDGSGDFLATAHDPKLSVANGDHTIEGKLTPSSLSGVKAFVVKRNTSSTPTGFSFGIENGKLFAIAWGGGGNTVVFPQGNTVLKVGVSYRVALVIKGLVWSIYLDGILEASASRTGEITGNTSSVLIGRDPTNSGRDFAGRIDEFRWTGVARYTENYTPATEPFPSR
ncbi:hypothetical protein MFKK_25080 [Halopseudomonas aestusnigri]|uniref:LamG domain-containing protein n=1 Tax=Halopseudomonas TaxID=2901189 RepID=UPI0022B675DD|nr:MULTISPECIES: LamG domain-containing protein [Halopseudomonas]BDX19698.1 hypothetical protein MFKK_25080 [Halopseudomonas aestusnigri]